MAAVTTGLMESVQRRQWPAIVAAIGGAIFVLGILALHVIERDLDPVNEIISAYGAGSHWYILTASFFAFSIGYVALSFGLGTTVAPSRGLTAARALLLLAAAAMFANGIIPCDAACGNTTLQGTLHSVLSFPFFLGTIAAMFLLIGPFGNDARWRPIRRTVIAIAVYALVTTLMLFAWRAAGIASWGLVQRLIVIGIVAFYAISTNQLRLALAKRG